MRSLSDPYGRFEALMQIDVDDDDGVSGITETCTSCFIWQYKEKDQWMNGLILE